MAQQIITISNVAEMKERLAMLSSNVRPTDLNGTDGTVSLWCEKGKLLVFADGRNRYGYFMTSIEEKWVSPVYQVLQTFLTKVFAIVPPDAPVIMEFLENGMINVRSESAGISFSMRAVHADKKPKFELPPQVAEFDLDAESIKKIQKKLVPCATSNTNNPSTDGIGFVIKDDNDNGSKKIGLYATNTHIISEYKLADVSFTGDVQLLLSKDVWGVTPPGEENSLHYKITDKSVVVSGKGFGFMFQNLVGHLMPYEKALNLVQHTHSIEMDAVAFSKAIKATGLLARIDNGYVEMSFSGNEVSLFTEDKSLGCSKMSVPFTADATVATALNGKTVCASYGYLLKGGNACDDVVKMSFADPAISNFALKTIKFETGENSVMMVSPVNKQAASSVKEASQGNKDTKVA